MGGRILGSAPDQVEKRRAQARARRLQKKLEQRKLEALRERMWIEWNSGLPGPSEDQTGFDWFTALLEKVAHDVREEAFNRVSMYYETKYREGSPGAKAWIRNRYELAKRIVCKESTWKEGKVFEECYLGMLGVYVNAWISGTVRVSEAGIAELEKHGIVAEPVLTILDGIVRLCKANVEDLYAQWCSDVSLTRADAEAWLTRFVRAKFWNDFFKERIEDEKWAYPKTLRKAFCGSELISETEGGEGKGKGEEEKEEEKEEGEEDESDIECTLAQSPLHLVVDDDGLEDCFVSRKRKRQDGPSMGGPLEKRRKEEVVVVVLDD